MGIKIDNKTYLNLPEQVEKNRVDIENLQGQGGYYTQEEADAKFETKEYHNTSINELKRAVRLINKDLQSTNTNVNTNTNEIAVVKGDVTAVNTKIDKVTRDVSSLGTSVDAIDKKADQNSTDISNLGSSFNDLRTTTLSLNSSKQDKLKAGNNITISADNTISAQVDDVVLKPTDVFNATADSDTIVRDVVNDKVEFHVSDTVNNTINNKLDKPVGITDTELVGFNTEQVNIKIGNNLTLENNTLNAVGGGTVDAYTKAESDAKYETIDNATQAHGELTNEINSVNTTQTENYNNVNNRVDALDNKVDAITPIVPTDIAVNEGKLGLKHDTTWLTNQNAINLGSNLTYDANTNTLNATGGGGTVDAYTKAESDDKYATKEALTTETSSRDQADREISLRIGGVESQVSELKTPALFQTSILYDDTMSKQYKLFYAVDSNLNPIVSVNDTYLGFAVDGDVDETTVTLAPNSIGNPYPCIHIQGGGGGTDDAYTKSESDARYVQIEPSYKEQRINGDITAHGTGGAYLKASTDLGTKYSKVNYTSIGVYDSDTDYARFTKNYFEHNSKRYYFPWETLGSTGDIFLSKNNFSKYVSTVAKGDLPARYGLNTNVVVDGTEYDELWLKDTNNHKLASFFLTSGSVTPIGNVIATGGFCINIPDVSSYYTKTESDEKYQPKGTYVVPSDLDAYEKKSELTTTLDNYVTTTSLTTTLGDYALKTDIPTDFYTKAQSDEKYQVKGNYATTEQLSTKQDTITAGSNISITNNTIAVTGSEDWTFTLTDGTSVVKKVVVQ